MSPNWNWSPLVRRLTAAVVVLMVTVGALVIALVAISESADSSQTSDRAIHLAKQTAQLARQTARDAKQIADCINTNLGNRSAPAGRDADALLEFISGVSAFSAQPPNATPVQRLQAWQRFQRIVSDVQATLAQDKIDKSAHPLGRC